MDRGDRREIRRHGTHRRDDGGGRCGTERFSRQHQRNGGVGVIGGMGEAGQRLPGMEVQVEPAVFRGGLLFELMHSCTPPVVLV